MGRLITSIVLVLVQVGCGSSTAKKAESAAHESVVITEKMSANGEERDSVAVKRIRYFYSTYIAENLGEANDALIQSLLKEYCTARFFQKLDEQYKSGLMEADPVVDAQDFEVNWVNSLSVHRVIEEGDGVYAVCLLITHSNTQHCLHVAMKMEGNSWKIDDIKSVK